MFFSNDVDREIAPEVLAWAADLDESGEWERNYNKDYTDEINRLEAEQYYGVYGPYWDASGQYRYGYRGDWPNRD